MSAITDLTNSLYSSNSSSTNNSNSSSSNSSGTGQLGEADFMTLLIAQLKNQDPLNPTDNTQFVSELATFSSLQEQTTQTQSLQQSTAVGLIGTYVEDSKGDKGVVQSVSYDSTNGLQLTINTTQTDSSGKQSTVPVKINYSDLTFVSDSSSVTSSSTSS